MTISFSEGAAIVGIGTTEFARSIPETPTRMAARAFKAALDDAGLCREDIDGFTTHYGVPLGVDFDRFAEAMGLNLRWASQYWLHGRFVTTALQNAAFAVMAGLADVVACVTSVKFLNARAGLGGDGDHENRREGGGTHGEEPAYGLTSPAGGAAIGFRRYCSVHGLDEGLLYHVVAGARAHAARNPRAMRREPFDRTIYDAEPLIIEPMRRADCALLSDGAVVLLVTSIERARDLSRTPVFIKGMQGMRAGADEFVFAPRGLGICQQGIVGPLPDKHPRQVFEMAGVAPGDIDALYTYDAFAPLIPYVLERFGHCEAGQGLHFAAGGGTAPDGRMPVNTNGGLIAEAHVAGWNTLAELVRQIRGEAGPTQLPRADNLQWGTAWGDSIIFGAQP